VEKGARKVLQVFKTAADKHIDFSNEEWFKLVT